MSREREPLPSAWEVHEDGTRTPMPRTWVKKSAPPIHIPTRLRLVEVYDDGEHLLAILYRDGDDALLWLAGHYVGPSMVLTVDGEFQGLAGVRDGDGRLRYVTIGSALRSASVGCVECRREYLADAAMIAEAVGKTRRGRPARVTL